MIKPGGFLKKIGKTLAAPAKAMGGAAKTMAGGGVVGGLLGKKKKPAAGGPGGGGSIFGGKKGEKMGAAIAKHKESRAANKLKVSSM